MRVAAEPPPVGRPGLRWGREHRLPRLQPVARLNRALGLLQIHLHLLGAGPLGGRLLESARQCHLHLQAALWLAADLFVDDCQSRLSTLHFLPKTTAQRVNLPGHWAGICVC